MEKFAPKILEKNSCQRGIYRQIWKLAVGSRFCQNNPAGRPVRSTAQRSIFARWQLPVDRPGRPKQTESSALSPVDPSGRPSQCLQTCTDLCTSVDRPGRPTSCQVNLVRRLVDWLKPGTENWVRKTV